MSFDEPTGVRGSWIYRDGKLVPHDKKKKIVNAPYVRVDEVDAFVNPVTGKMETSMSTYRKNLKRDGYFEKGNDRMQYKLPSREERMKDVNESRLEAERQIKYGMGRSTSGEREIWETKSESERLEKMERMQKDQKRERV